MMGNTNPHMDNVETIKYVLEKGAKTGINVYTCANVTMNMEGKEQVDMEKLLDAGAVLFTDDGKPITDEKIMEAAGKADFGGMLQFDSNLLDKAAECGHGSFCIMAGAFDGLDGYC